MSLPKINTDLGVEMAIIIRKKRNAAIVLEFYTDTTLLNQRDITGSTFTLTVIDPTTERQILQLTEGAGLTVQNTAQLKIELDEDQSALVNKIFWYDLKEELADGFIYSPFYGDFQVNKSAG